MNQDFPKGAKDNSLDSLPPTVLQAQETPHRGAKAVGGQHAGAHTHHDWEGRGHFLHLPKEPQAVGSPLSRNRLGKGERC